MKHNQNIDFFSSPTTPFVGFSELHHLEHHDNPNEEDQDSQHVVNRKVNNYLQYNPIVPLAQNFFQQSLSQQEYNSQDNCDHIHQGNKHIIKCQVLSQAIDKDRSESRNKLVGINIQEQEMHQAQQSLFQTPKRKAQMFAPQSTCQKSHSRNTSKGLRKLSSLAFNIVSNSSAATYKQVAQKLLTRLRYQTDIDCQEKSGMQNVKRRVYDSLNVLLALGVIKRVGNKIVRHRQNRNTPKDHFNDQDKYHQVVANYRRTVFNLQIKKKNQHQLQQKLEMFRQIVQRNKKTKSITKSTKIIKLPFLLFVNNERSSIFSSQTKGTLDIKWLSDTQRNIKDKKPSISKKPLAVCQIQQKKQSQVQIRFKDFPDSYGDLDFFKLLKNHTKNNNDLFTTNKYANTQKLGMVQEILNDLSH